MSTLLLTLPDFPRHFILETNALGHEVGTMLMSHEKLITYYGQVLLGKNRFKSAYEKELIAIVMAA